MLGTAPLPPRLPRPFPFTGPVPDEADPPRKNYGFKDREFKRDNALSSAEPPPPTAKELAMMSGPVAKKADLPSVALAKEGDPNDVYALLQQNRAVEKQHHLDEFEIKKIKNRRRRDYWLLLFTIESTLGVVAYVGRGNPFVFACSIAAMGFLALGLTWIMWQVMSKY
jgi:hypothetical protein